MSKDFRKNKRPILRLEDEFEERGKSHELSKRTEKDLPTSFMYSKCISQEIYSESIKHSNLIHNEMY